MDPSDITSLQPESGSTVSPETWKQWESFVADAFKLPLTGEAVERFKTLLRELKEWNAKFNLVSVRSDEEILWRHFADSLAGLALIATLPAGGTTVCDIGTGAGFPGIPAKIVRPDLSLTLIESVAKKCSFLEHVTTALGLAPVTLINDRAETVGQDRRYRASFDFVLSRAVAKFSPNLEIAVPLLKTGGRAVIYKTERSAFGEEGLPSVERAMKLLGAELEETFCYTLPGEEQTYCVLAFKKTAETPPLYPRRPGMPEKKPL